jgi:hypothetical protein
MGQQIRGKLPKEVKLAISKDLRKACLHIVPVEGCIVNRRQCINMGPTVCRMCKWALAVDGHIQDATGGAFSNLSRVPVNVSTGFY